VVNFGDPLPTEEWRRAAEHARACDLMLVLGSSLVVNPAASLVGVAVEAGARVVLVNQGETPYDEAVTLRVWAGIGDDDDPHMAEFARIWKATPKIVFSTTLQGVEGDARLVREGAGEEVARLKEQPGKDLAVGGAGLASALIRLGLVDEYRSSGSATRLAPRTGLALGSRQPRKEPSWRPFTRPEAGGPRRGTRRRSSRPGPSSPAGRARCPGQGRSGSRAISPIRAAS
jgi:hypothetical protein